MQVWQAEIAILSLYLALVPAVNAATSQVLSTESQLAVRLLVNHRDLVRVRFVVGLCVDQLITRMITGQAPPKP